MLRLFLIWAFFPLISLNAICIHEMTLEEKVGQLLVVHFHGHEANEDAKILIQDIKVGGIVYYRWSNGLHSPKKIKKLSDGLQNLSSVPLFIAVDEEGGSVARLTSGFSTFPSNWTIGKTKSPEYARLSALIRGNEMRAVGINVNFAPVVDIVCNPKHAFMKARSFGSNPDIVIAFAEKALEGYFEAGIIATLKHYPGHGDAKGDSHVSLPVINKSLAELEQTELLPFERLSPHAEIIMTGHLFVPALDIEKCATLSEKVLGYLKNKIGYQGLIISDSLAMEGVLNGSTPDAAAIEALKAGCNLLLLGGQALSPEKGTFELSVSDMQRIHASIVQAVKTGQISEEHINESVEKIIRVKERYIISQF